MAEQVPPIHESELKHELMKPLHTMRETAKVLSGAGFVQKMIDLSDSQKDSCSRNPSHCLSPLDISINRDNELIFGSLVYHPLGY